MERHCGATWTVRVALPTGPHLLTCYAQYAPADAHGAGTQRRWPAQMLGVFVRRPVARAGPTAAAGRWGDPTADAEARPSPPVWVDVPLRPAAEADERA